LEDIRIHKLYYGFIDNHRKIIKEAAEIIGIQNIGQIKPGFKASIAVWNGDPFSLFSHPILVIAEGRTVYDER
jgi:imidazolonepropionase-like amidohydrolase